MTSRLTVFCVGTAKNVTPGTRECLRRGSVQVRAVHCGQSRHCTGRPSAAAYGAQVAVGSGRMPYDGAGSGSGAGSLRGSAGLRAVKDVGEGVGLVAARPP